MRPDKIAVFASGTGSNALKIIDYFRDKQYADIALIVSNKSTAGIISNPAAGHIPKLIITRHDFYKTNDLLSYLREHGITFIVLAGFLWKIPEYLIHSYPGKIINIHPALLPKYGGKGMYGNHVHEAVFANEEKQSGMTIHFVNENYDEGAIIFQSECDIQDASTPTEIARRVLILEHKYYAQIIDQVLDSTSGV